MSATLPRKVIHMIRVRDDKLITTLCHVKGIATNNDNMYRTIGNSPSYQFMAVDAANTHTGATCKHCRARIFARRQNNERSLMPKR